MARATRNKKRKNDPRQPFCRRSSTRKMGIPSGPVCPGAGTSLGPPLVHGPSNICFPPARSYPMVFPTSGNWFERDISIACRHEMRPGQRQKPHFSGSIPCWAMSGTSFTEHIMPFGRSTFSVTWANSATGSTGGSNFRICFPGFCTSPFGPRRCRTAWQRMLRGMGDQVFI